MSRECTNLTTPVFLGMGLAFVPLLRDCGKYEQSDV